MTPDWFSFERDVILRAGAGAGKTHALVSLYLHLVGGASAHGTRVPPTSIVAISFTDKAASELNVKIRARLARLVREGPAAEPDLLATAARLGLTLPPAAAWEACLEELGGAPVGTFHRLGGLLLRRHAIEAGIDPAARQLDEVEATERLTACAERVVLDGLENQQPGVLALVLELGFSGGGFASGLVETLIELHQKRAEEGRGAAGLDESYAPARLALALEDAGRALSRSARALVEMPGLPPKWTALQGRLRALLPALQARLAAPASLDEPGGPEALATAVAGAVAVVASERLPARAESLREARETFQDAAELVREQLRARTAAPLAAALARLTGELGRRYAEDKRRLGALDFTDLVLGARDLLRDHPAVLAAERGRIAALLVDEFQDTNAVQADLVELLAGPPTKGGPGRLFVVGDRKQSIYEFRGADVGVFVRFEAARLAGGARREVLPSSRRSLPALVGLANGLFARVFSGGPEDFEIAWDPATDPLAPVREGDPAAPACELLRAGGDTTAERRFAEAGAIAERLATLRKEGVGDLALLLRSYTHLEVYLEALRARCLPHYVVNGRGFFEAQEIRDLAAALRILDDPDDCLALVSLLRSPLVALSDETLLRLATGRALRLDVLLGARGAAFTPPLGESVTGPAGETAYQHDDGEAARFARFRSLFSELRRRADRLGPAAVLGRLVDETGLEVILAAGYQGEQRVANLARLVEKARSMEEAGGDLRGFVRWLSRLTEPGSDAGADQKAAQAPIASERADVVRVMTVHQAKGLEFAVVAVGALGSGEQFDRGAVSYDPTAGLGIKLREEDKLAHAGPSRGVLAMRKAKAEAEARRLFYVAATRARDRLLLAGETSREAGHSWRHLLDEACAADPALGVLIVEQPAAPRLGSVLAAAVAPPLLPEGTDEDTARVLARLVPRSAPARMLTVAVTQLADFALCPRRHHLFHVVGLAEHPRAARAASPALGAAAESPGVAGAGAASELDALTRGTLAHHLLERADLGVFGPSLGPHLDTLLAASGYDPADRTVSDVREHARRFLETPFARGLHGAGVRRELPFILAIDPAPGGVTALRLRGQIDLLTLEGDTVSVVDYKHARRGSDDEYRFQLDAYALAARRLFPGARRVLTGLAYLREADPTPRLVAASDDETRAFADSLATLADALARARSAGHFAGRPVATCREIGCGYLARCHPAKRAAAASDEPH